ncbi:hypothetical protein HD554DRAFT_2034481 [Boletus coccyginus]|nr:hypothetical protein HD554DRAFT_2034481 [Boletus coccyginus]
MYHRVHEKMKQVEYQEQGEVMDDGGGNHDEGKVEKVMLKEVWSCVIPGERYNEMNIKGEKLEVEVEGEGKRKRERKGEMKIMADDRENVLGEKEKTNEIQDFFAEIEEDLDLELEINPIAQDRSTSEDDGTRTSTDVALKCKRAVLMRLTSPEVGISVTWTYFNEEDEAFQLANPNYTNSISFHHGGIYPQINPMDTLNTVEGSDNGTSAVDDFNKGHKDKDEMTPHQKHNRGHPRQVPQGQRKVKVKSSKRSPNSPEKIYSKVVVHKNSNWQTYITGPAENNNNVSEVTMPPPQIWTKVAAVYMNEAMTCGNLMLMQDSAALQNDLITLVQALFAIEADFELVSDWMTTLNKLSDFHTMIHKAHRESEAKPEELGWLGAPARAIFGCEELSSHSPG